jgi:hypothetical protein
MYVITAYLVVMAIILVRRKRVMRITAIIAAIFAVPFILTLLLAISVCGLCSGPTGDVYFLPFIAAPTGIWGTVKVSLYIFQSLNRLGPKLT